MTPFTVTAHLSTPPVITGPLMLDSALLWGLGATLGREHPSGWAADEDVEAAAEDGGLGLARVRDWWACSQVTPWGPEQRLHLHRRPGLEVTERYTGTRSVNVAAGPDKALRRPFFVRIAMRRLVWTCVGEEARVRALLSRVPSVGAMVAHGHGWVERWEVERGGPPIGAYSEDVRLRHLPIEAVPQASLMLIGRTARKLMPLRPPYWRRDRAVSVLQIPEVDDG